MSGIIGSLGIGVKVNTAGMSKGFKRATRMVRKFARRSAVVTGAALGGGTLAALAITRRAARDIDSVAKTADKLGVSTKALIGLQHAGEQTGVSVNTTNMALQRLTRRVAEAAQGTGEAKGALKELRLDAEMLNSVSLDVKMGMIADAMASIENPADKVRLSMKLFDSEGVSLVNTLALGSEGLVAMQKRTEQLGMSFSRVDARKVEAALDSLNESGKAVGGVFQSLAIEAAPFATAAANEFIRIQGVIRQTGFTWEAFSGKAVEDIGQVGDASSQARDAIGDSIGAIAKTVGRGIDAFHMLSGGARVSFNSIAISGLWLARSVFDIVEMINGTISSVRQVAVHVAMDVVRAFDSMTRPVRSVLANLNADTIRALSVVNPQFGAMAQAAQAAFDKFAPDKMLNGLEKLGNRIQQQEKQFTAAGAKITDPLQKMMDARQAGLQAGLEQWHRGVDMLSSRAADSVVARIRAGADAAADAAQAASDKLNAAGGSGVEMATEKLKSLKSVANSFSAVAVRKSLVRLLPGGALDGDVAPAAYRTAARGAPGGNSSGVQQVRDAGVLAAVQKLQAAVEQLEMRAV